MKAWYITNSGFKVNSLINISVNKIINSPLNMFFNRYIIIIILGKYVVFVLLQRKKKQ